MKTRTKKSTIGYVCLNPKASNEIEKFMSDPSISQKYQLKRVDDYGFKKIYSNKFRNKLLGSLRRVHLFYHFALIWKHRNATLNYKLRAYCMFGTNKQFSEYSSFAIYKDLRVNLILRIAVKGAGNFFIIYFLRKFLFLCFAIGKVYDDEILNNINVMLFMYGARISLEQDYLVWISKRKKLKTVFIQENWDNLSSKTIMMEHPEFFATWGAQSTSHLKNIHKFNGTAWEIGSVRLNAHFKIRTEKYKTHLAIDGSSKTNTSIKKLLLIGNGDGQHDFLLAEECARIINKINEKRKSTLRIVYRPHPYGSNLVKNLDKFSDLDNVFVKLPQKGETSEERAAIILDCFAVISLYSTMLLEASILNKLCIIPGFIESNWNYPTPQFVIESEHYKGMDSLDGVYVPKSYIKFEEILLNIENSFRNVHNSKELLNWFCKDVNSIDSLINLLDVART